MCWLHVKCTAQAGNWNPTWVKIAAPAGMNDTQFIMKLMQLAIAYNVHENNDHILYPSTGLPTNSNSWARAILLAAGAKPYEHFDNTPGEGNAGALSQYFQPSAMWDVPSLDGLGGSFDLGE